MTSYFTFLGQKNNGSPAFGHVINTVTLFLQALLWFPAIRPYIFLWENPVNAATPLIRKQRHSEIPACIILYNYTPFIRPLEPISPLFIWHAVVEGLILCLHSGWLSKNSCLEVQCWYTVDPPVVTAYPQQPVFQNTKSVPLKCQIFTQHGLRSRKRPPRFGILGGRFREVRLYLLAHTVC